MLQFAARGLCGDSSPGAAGIAVFVGIWRCFQYGALCRAAAGGVQAGWEQSTLCMCCAVVPLAGLAPRWG